MKFPHDKPSTQDRVAGFEVRATDYLSKSDVEEVLIARVGAAARQKVAIDRLRHKNAKLEAGMNISMSAHRKHRNSIDLQ